MTTPIAKHEKYKDMYGSNELFWGIGIELETYLQYTKKINVACSIIRSNHKQERYSLNYYNTFKPGYEKYFDEVFPDASGFIPLPLFLNGHSLQKTDIKGNHQTTFEKIPKINPLFSGKTVLDELQEFDRELFFDGLNKEYVFDGDTIEFMTLNFYKVKADKCIRELVDFKKRFIRRINDFLVSKRYHLERGSLCYPPVNPGWAIYCTNNQNVTMFNNGTYHVNITLPSFLGVSQAEQTQTLQVEPAQLLYPVLFKQTHKKAILYYQWLEPFLISMYGTSDPFSAHFPEFSKSSQRCAVSRYIGIGTYDTETMTEGKILTSSISEITGTDSSFWWYKRYHEKSAYQPFEKIGMDINYRKHYNHGIELRFFDWFPEEHLQELLCFLIRVADCSSMRPEAPPAIQSETWNDFVLGIMQEGKEFIMTEAMVASYEKLFLVTVDVPKNTVKSVFACLRTAIVKKYKHGYCSKLML
jgi:hypothetical protein